MCSNGGVVFVRPLYLASELFAVYLAFVSLLEIAGQVDADNDAFIAEGIDIGIVFRE